MRLGLAIVAVVLGGCPSRASRTPAVVTPPVVAREAVVATALVEGDVPVFAADGDAVYWIADDALWRRSWRGAATRLAALPTVGLALAVQDQRVIVIGATTIAAAPIAGGAVATIVSGLPPWRVVTIDRDGAWFGTDSGVYRAPLDGGGPEQIARALPGIEAIATDDAHLYIAAAAGIVRVGKRGGASVVLAEGQDDVRGLAAGGDRVWWARRDGPAVTSVATAGGAPRIELDGAAVAIAADGRGAVIMTPTGALAEVAAAGARIARGHATHRLAGAGSIALAGDGVVVPMLDLATGGGSLWRVARPADGRDAATIVAAPRHAVTAIAVDGAEVVYVDASRGDGPSRVMRAPRGGGRGRAIASAPAIDALAVDGGRVAYAAGAAIWLVDRNPVGDASGDRPPRRLTTAPDPPLGLTLDARAVYWADGHQLLTARLAGGAAAIFASPAPQAASPQRGAVELIVDGDAVYFSSLGDGAAGVFRASRGGPAHTLAADEPTLGDGLARVGRALYAIVDGSGILRVPMDGGAVDRLVLDDDGTTLVRVVGGGDAVIALRLIGGTAQLEELDPTTGARRPLWMLPSGSEATPNALTADEAAVYTYLSDTAWLIAVPRHGAAGRSAAHEVSAQRPTKAPPTRGPGALSR